jgi:thiol-disulfide isomerase/thioredoxin
MLTLASCRSYRTLEGRGKPVYFTADASVFRDTVSALHSISYRTIADLKGAVIETAELKEGVITKVIIKKPTMFLGGYSSFLVYPGERIIVKGKADSLTFFDANGNKQRNRELLFCQKLHELRQQQLLQYSHIPSFLPGSSLEKILTIEQQKKDRIRKVEAMYQSTFDSLSKAYDVSSKFKKLIDGYTKSTFSFDLADFYSLHRDTLMAHGLYFLKLREFIPVVNGITKRSDFNSTVRQGLNNSIGRLFPENFMWSFDDENFEACFDSVENNFTGFARDYLLSRLMYRAYAKGTKVSSEYVKKYESYPIDKLHIKIVKNTRKQRSRNDKDKLNAPNKLLTADGKSEIALETLLSQYTGKYVYMDLWASWCVPCIKEMPYLQQKIEKYPINKIIFLTVSIDKDAFRWRSEIIQRNIKGWNNFLLIDAAKTSFSKQYKINEIPRYLLFDKQGKVINSQAPAPSVSALDDLFDKLIID